jgi:hypothetical protein
VTEITYADVSRHAAAMGLRVDEFYRDRDDRYWLTVTTNWQTTTPGRTLTEISSELDERDGGAWRHKMAGEPE